MDCNEMELNGMEFQNVCVCMHLHARAHTLRHFD